MKYRFANQGMRDRKINLNMLDHLLQKYHLVKSFGVKAMIKCAVIRTYYCNIDYHYFNLPNGDKFKCDYKKNNLKRNVYLWKALQVAFREKELGLRFIEDADDVAEMIGNNHKRLKDNTHLLKDVLADELYLDDLNSLHRKLLLKNDIFTNKP